MTIPNRVMKVPADRITKPPNNVRVSRARGRPRNPETDAAIVAAVIEELALTTYDNLRVEAVAQRAGVASTTIYRRYKSKMELVKAAVHQVSLGFELDPTQPLEVVIRAIVQQTVDSYANGPTGAAMFNLFLEAIRNPDLVDIKNEAQFNRDAMRNYLAGRQRCGELRTDVDLGVVMDVVGAVVPLRVLLTGEPIPDNLADLVLAIVIEGIRPKRGRRS